MNPQQNPSYGPPPPGYQPGYPGYPGQPGQQPPYPPGPANMPAPQPGYIPQAPYAPPGYANGMPPTPPGMQPHPHSSGYNPNPYPGEVEPPESPVRKIILMASAAIMVLILVSVVVKLVSDARDVQVTNDKTKTGTVSTGGAPDVATRTDGKLDLSQHINTQSTLKEQSLQASIKQQVNLSNGFSFMVTDVKSYTPADPAVVPVAGKKFISVSVVAGNRANSGSKSISYLDFKLRNGRNELLTGDGATLKLLNNYMASPVSLNPGDQVSGTIIFQVDLDATEWSLVHSETYQKITDGTSFNVQGSVALQLVAASATPPAGS